MQIASGYILAGLYALFILVLWWMYAVTQKKNWCIVYANGQYSALMSLKAAKDGMEVFAAPCIKKVRGVNAGRTIRNTATDPSPEDSAIEGTYADIPEKPTPAAFRLHR